MRAQTILFLSVDGVKEKLDCRPYRGGGEGQSQETTRGCKPRLFKPVDYFDHTTCYSEKTGLRLVLTSHMGSNPTTHPKFPRRNICDNTGHLTYSAGHAEESISFAKHNMGTYARESGFSIRSSNTRSRIDTRFAGQWPWRGCYEDSEISG